MFKEGKSVKAKSGKGAIGNAKGKVKALSSKKPAIKSKAGSGAAPKVSGKVSALSSKNPGPKKAKAKDNIAHAKRAVKLANYKF